MYGTDMPVRGDIQIAIRNKGTEGTTGVTGAVLTLITGAAGDTGKTIGLSFNIEAVPFRPQMQELLPMAIAGTLPEQDRGRFADLWQDRVKRMLLEHAEDPALIQIRDL